MSTPSWYAIRVRSNFEHTTATFLSSMGYDVFLPVYHARRKWSDRVKDIQVPLFSGYLFCSMDITKRLPVLQAPGVVNIVGCGTALTPVPDEEIEAVRTIVNSKVAVQPWPYLHTGDTIRIQHGPLAGIEGIVVEMKSCTRLIVRINLLQRAVAAEVDVNWVRQGYAQSPSGTESQSELSPSGRSKIILTGSK